MPARLAGTVSAVIDLAYPGMVILVMDDDQGGGMYAVVDAETADSIADGLREGAAKARRYADPENARRVH